MNTTCTDFFYLHNDYTDIVFYLCTIGGLFPQYILTIFFYLYNVYNFVFFKHSSTYHSLTSCSFLQAPQFGGLPTSVTVGEQETADRLIYTLTVTDADNDPFNCDISTSTPAAAPFRVLKDPVTNSKATQSYLQVKNSCNQQ